VLNVQRALKSDRILRALTGLNRKAFEELKPAFAQALAEAEVPRRSRLPRQRASGARRKPRLATVEARLFFILFYFKVYPIFDLAGLLFDLDRAQANRWTHRLQPLLEEALGEELALPKRKITRLNNFIKAFPDVERMILDGTERPIQRAKDRDQQQEDYSGKKKRHTRTHLAAVAPDRQILVFSTAYPGKAHDKGILNTEGWAKWIPDDVKIQGDLGFQGLQNEYVNLENPHKQPKDGQLTDEQKAENQALAREQVVGEHAFAGLKRYGITAQVYRHRKPNFDDRSLLTAAGLWNFYLMAA
jgi:hypothetical protein